jgi:hypothetical protein
LFLSSGISDLITFSKSVVCFAEAFRLSQDTWSPPPQFWSLDDGRTDPCVDDNRCLIETRKAGHDGVVALLLEDGNKSSR